MTRSRFDRLELPRKPNEEHEPRSAVPSPQRFDAQPAVEGAEAPRSTPSSPAGLERFASDGSAALTLDRRPAEEQPFVRCPQCGRDWPIGRAQCGSCEGALVTAEVEAFNRQLWQQRDAQAREEQRLTEEREAEAAREQALENEQRRQRGVDIAKAVKARYGGWSGRWWQRAELWLGIALLLRGLSLRHLRAASLVLGVALIAGGALYRRWRR